MKNQMRALLGMNRFRVLVAMAGVILATSVAIGSGASFATVAVNASNVFSTGTLSMSNTPTGMSTTIANMVPGDSRAGTVVMKNTSTLKGHFYLEPVVISGDTKGFSAQAQLLVKDGSTTVYSGSLSGLVQKDLGTWAAGETHTYAFTVSFPDQGVDAQGIGMDNAFMGATTTATFNWTGVSVPTGSL
jgi:hypothetical protein